MPTADSWVAATGVYDIEAVEGTVDAVPTFAAIGFITGGNAEINENTVGRQGIGSQYQNKPGRVEPTIRAEVECQTSVLAVLFLASPTASHSIDIGVNRTNATFRFRGCKPQTLGIEAALDAALKYTYDWEAWDGGPAAAATEVELANAIHEWFEAAVTIGGSALYAQRWQCNVANAYKPFWELDTAGANVKRARAGHAQGLQMVEASMDILSPHALGDAGDDAIADIASVHTSTSADGGTTIVHTLSNLKRISAGFAVGGADDLWVESLRFQGKPSSLVLS